MTTQQPTGRPSNTAASASASATPEPMEPRVEWGARPSGISLHAQQSIHGDLSLPPLLFFLAAHPRQPGRADHAKPRTRAPLPAETTPADRSADKSSEKSADKSRDEAKDRSKGRRGRPLNAFLLFCMEWRPRVRHADPFSNNNEASRTLGKIWKQMPDAARLPFQQRAHALRQSHWVDSSPNDFSPPETSL